MVTPDAEFLYSSRLNIIRELVIIDNFNFFKNFDNINFINFNNKVVNGKHCEDNFVFTKADIEKILKEAEDKQLLTYKRYIYQNIDDNKIFYFNSSIKAIYEYKLELKTPAPDFIELIYLYHKEIKSNGNHKFYREILELIRKICIEKKLFNEFKESDIDFFIHQGK